MTDIKYRETKPDHQQYMELFETTGWNTVYKVSLEDLKKVLDNSWYVLTAYHENELVGIGRIVSDGVLYAMIYDMIVNPLYQNKGIGATILSKLVEKCKATELRDIQLFSAKGKAQFYSKRGFLERPAGAPGMRYRSD